MGALEPHTLHVFWHKNSAFIGSLQILTVFTRCSQLSSASTQPEATTSFVGGAVYGACMLPTVVDIFVVKDVGGPEFEYRLLCVVCRLFVTCSDPDDPPHKWQVDAHKSWAEAGIEQISISATRTWQFNCSSLQFGSGPL